MFGISEIILAEIKKTISKYEEIDRVLLFGSRARGNYKKTSDIDIAIFAPTISSCRLNLLRDSLDELDIIYKIDVVNFYTISKEALKLNIINDGVEIYLKNMDQR